MKRKVAFILTFPLLFVAVLLFTAPTSDPSFNDGSLYELDLDNSSTYTVSCYDVLTSSQWVVKNASCTLTTAVINLPGDPAVDPKIDVPVNFTFSKSGTLESDDDILIQYEIDDNGWEDLAHIEGDDVPGSPTVYGYRVSEVNPGSDITFRIIMKTDNNSEKLTLHTTGGSGYGIQVGTPYLVETYELFRSASLPITLASFTGSADKEKVQLQWVTSSEINNEHFEIERSTSGDEFQTVTIIQGAGTSNIMHQYSADDYSPAAGTNYYRIKQVDYDGKYSYSEIISVINENQQQDCKMSIRPNPCLGECQVVLEDCPQASKEGFTVYIYDALGNVVTTRSSPVAENSTTLTLDVNNIYKPGVYIVRGKICPEKVIDEKVVFSN